MDKVALADLLGNALRVCATRGMQPPFVVCVIDADESRKPFWLSIDRIDVEFEIEGDIILLLPLHHFAGEANDHVVLIGLSVDRDGTECSASDLHGLILVPSLSVRLERHENVPSR